MLQHKEVSGNMGSAANMLMPLVGGAATGYKIYSQIDQSNKDRQFNQGLKQQDSDTKRMAQITALQKQKEQENADHQKAVEMYTGDLQKSMGPWETIMKDPNADQDARNYAWQQHQLIMNHLNDAHATSDLPGLRDVIRKGSSIYGVNANPNNPALKKGSYYQTVEDEAKARGKQANSAAGLSDASTGETLALTPEKVLKARAETRGLNATATTTELGNDQAFESQGPETAAKIAEANARAAKAKLANAVDTGTMLYAPQLSQAAGELPPAQVAEIQASTAQKRAVSGSITGLQEPKRQELLASADEKTANAAHTRALTATEEKMRPINSLYRELEGKYLQGKTGEISATIAKINAEVKQLTNSGAVNSSDREALDTLTKLSQSEFQSNGTVSPETSAKIGSQIAIIRIRGMSQQAPTTIRSIEGLVNHFSNGYKASDIINEMKKNGSWTVDNDAFVKNAEIAYNNSVSKRTPVIPEPKAIPRKGTIDTSTMMSPPKTPARQPLNPSLQKGLMGPPSIIPRSP